MTSPAGLARDLQILGKKVRAETGARDVVLVGRLKLAARVAEVIGRLALLLIASPWGWLIGLVGLSFYLALEAQLNHSIMHGAYVGLPGARERGFTPSRYETLALPFRSQTWREAHRIHHANPSLLGADPDTIHPLFRMHASQAWRPWHRFNAWLGAVLVFECWAFDYDRFLKATGHRKPNDRSELRKFALHVGYQYVLFPVLAGARWKEVLLVTMLAALIRNFVFTALQTGSSVGHAVSTAHCESFDRKRGDAFFRFQIETSKNFVLRGVWKVLCGGLDRHIEHHVFPNLPPNRLHEISSELQALCAKHDVRYVEFGSLTESLSDSVSYLESLST